MAQNLDYIHNQRGMPWVKLGMHVEVGGKRGVIRGGMGGNLAVVLAGQKHASNVHPSDDIKYFAADGSLLAVNGKLVEKGNGEHTDTSLDFSNDTLSDPQKPSKFL